MPLATRLDHQGHRKSSPQHQIVSGKTRFLLFFSWARAPLCCTFGKAKMSSELEPTVDSSKGGIVGNPTLSRVGFYAMPPPPSEVEGIAKNRISDVLAPK